MVSWLEMSVMMSTLSVYISIGISNGRAGPGHAKMLGSPRAFLNKPIGEGLVIHQ